MERTFYLDLAARGARIPLAALIPTATVLYGNLPTKLFYSDDIMPVRKVRAITCELVEQMQKINRSFILGSEGDVLGVVGREAVIAEKNAVMLHSVCP